MLNNTWRKCGKMFIIYTACLILPGSYFYPSYMKFEKQTLSQLKKWFERKNQPIWCLKSQKPHCQQILQNISNLKNYVRKWIYKTMSNIQKSVFLLSSSGNSIINWNLLLLCNNPLLFIIGRETIAAVRGDWFGEKTGTEFLILPFLHS